jgi:hypothetical protein
MRLRLPLTIILLCFTAVQLPPAHSAVKAGTPCKKPGAETIANNKKYTCIKTGKKLLWNTGVRYKVTTPIATPSPSNSPIEDLLLLEINTALNRQIPKVDINSVDDSLVGELIVEPGINSFNVETTKILMRKLYLAQPVMKLVKPPVVILGHSETFVKSEFSRRCAQNIDWVGAGDNSMSNYNNWALAGCLDTNPVQIIPMPKEVVAVKHIAGALGSDMGYVAIGFSTNTKFLPGWFVRGLKGVVGEYMTSLGESSWSVTKNGAESCTQFSLNELSYSFEISRNWCQTSLGQGASRYMVAKKGLEPTLIFINGLQRKGSWSDADFESFLGMKFGEFEILAKDYILRQS